MPADSVAKARTPEPFSTSKTSNWIARVGGLPPYFQHVAHGIMESGKPRSEAIKIAIGRVEDWAAGKGNVDAGTRAASRIAVKEWAEKRAKNAAKITEEVEAAEAFLREAALVIGDKRVTEAVLLEKTLSADDRKALPSSAFALPGRKYPVHDEGHARAALTRVAQHGSPEEKKKVRAAVKRKHPKMNLSEATTLGAIEEELRERAILIEVFNPRQLRVGKGKSGGGRWAQGGAPSTSSGSAGKSAGAKTLAKGKSGQMVASVQSLLGMSNVDGHYGPKTKARVRQFQRSKGLQVDGVVGQQTVAALRGRTAASPGSLDASDRHFLRRGSKKLREDFADTRWDAMMHADPTTNLTSRVAQMGVADAIRLPDGCTIKRAANHYAVSGGVPPPASGLYADRQDFPPLITTSAGEATTDLLDRSAKSSGYSAVGGRKAYRDFADFRKQTADKLSEAFDPREARDPHSGKWINVTLGISKFDPKDPVGQLEHAIKGLNTPGDKVTTPDGITIQHGGGPSPRYTISGGSPSLSATQARFKPGTPREAAKAAASRSARGAHPDSIGGTTRHAGYVSAMGGKPTKGKITPWSNPTPEDIGGRTGYRIGHPVETPEGKQGHIIGWGRDEGDLGGQLHALVNLPGMKKSEGDYHRLSALKPGTGDLKKNASEDEKAKLLNDWERMHRPNTTLDGGEQAKVADALMGKHGMSQAELDAIAMRSAKAKAPPTRRSVRPLTDKQRNAIATGLLPIPGKPNTAAHKARANQINADLEKTNGTDPAVMRRAALHLEQMRKDGHLSQLGGKAQLDLQSRGYEVNRGGTAGAHDPADAPMVQARDLTAGTNHPNPEDWAKQHDLLVGQKRSLKVDPLKAAKAHALSKGDHAMADRIDRTIQQAEGRSSKSSRLAPHNREDGHKAALASIEAGLPAHIRRGKAVRTPGGNGRITKVSGHAVDVKLNDGREMSYADKDVHPFFGGSGWKHTGTDMKGPDTKVGTTPGGAPSSDIGVGDRVTWELNGRTIQGRVVRKQSGGKFVVKSEKSGKETVRRPENVKKIETSSGLSSTAPTPGYNHHLRVFFDLDKNGKRRAYYWSQPLGSMGRAIPLPLAKADEFVRKGQAKQIPHHPLKGPRG